MSDRVRDAGFRPASQSEAAAHLAAIVSSSGDAIISKALDGTILSWNASATRLFGWPADEAMGRHIALIVPAELLDEETRILRKLAHGEPVVHYETFRRRQDGQVIPVSLSISPVRDASGEAVGAASIARDITDRRRAEEAMRAAETFVRQELEDRVTARTRELETASAELELATRLRSEFLARISHELRTPLHGILGGTETVLSARAGPLTDLQREFLDDVTQSGRRLLNVVNDLLDQAAAEAGQLHLHVERVRVRPLLQGVIGSLRTLAAHKAITTTLTVHPSRGEVTADGRRLVQVAYNLLTNAIKFTPATGHVAMRVLPYETGFQLEVEDDGPGIPVAAQANLFVAYSQGDYPEARRQRGTGLGLSVVRAIAEAHGGRVELRSEIGAGSTFRVLFPGARPRRES